MKILPDDPLVKAVIWFVVLVSVGAPAILAVVLLITNQ